MTVEFEKYAKIPRLRGLEQKREAAKDGALELIADSLNVMPSDLGREWVEFAEAVADVVTTPHVGDFRAIGRLANAAVRLP